MSGSRGVLQTVSTISRVLTQAGLTPLARVRGTPDIYDIAFVSASGRSGVARCTNNPAASDIEALATMVHEGPFRIALLVSPKAHLSSQTSVICCGLADLRNTLVRLRL